MKYIKGKPAKFIKVVIAIDGVNTYQINNLIESDRINDLQEEIGDNIISEEQLKYLLKMILNEA